MSPVLTPKLPLTLGLQLMGTAKMVANLDPSPTMVWSRANRAQPDPTKTPQEQRPAQNVLLEVTAPQLGPLPVMGVPQDSILGPLQILFALIVQLVRLPRAPQVTLVKDVVRVRIPPIVEQNSVIFVQKEVTVMDRKTHHAKTVMQDIILTKTAVIPVSNALLEL